MDNNELKPILENIDHSLKVDNSGGAQSQQPVVDMKPMAEKTEESKPTLSVDEQLLNLLKNEELFRYNEGKLLVKNKIDGKEDYFSLDDIRKAHSGNVAVEKRFSELDKTKKQFEKEKKQIETYINTFREIGQTKGMTEALQYFAEFAGMPSHKLKEELIKSLSPELERRAVLSREEIEKELTEADLHYSKSMLEAEKNRIESERRELQLRNTIESLMQNHNVDADEWDKAVLELDAKLPKDEQITPEQVVEYVNYSRGTSRAMEALSSFGGGRLRDSISVSGSLQELAINNPDFTVEDLKEVLQKAYGEVLKPVVEEKVKTTEKQPAPSLKPYLGEESNQLYYIKSK